MNANDLSSTYRSGVAITPSDSADIPSGPVKGLWIGGTGGGNLKVTTTDNATFAIKAVAAGMLIPVSCKRVWATGTDVTDIVGLR